MFTVCLLTDDLQDISPFSPVMLLSCIFLLSGHLSAEDPDNSHCVGYFTEQDAQSTAMVLARCAFCRCCACATGGECCYILVRLQLFSIQVVSLSLSLCVCGYMISSLPPSV